MKVLLFDIETAPNISYTWGKYEQDVIKFKQEWYVLCWCAKWLNKKKVMKSKLNDFKLFNRDKTNDYYVVKELWKLLDEADVVIAHNGDKFDIRKINARFIYHGLPPPSQYKTIDTKKIARKYFSFNSNSLNDLGKHLKLGQKVETGGFNLWLECMSGKKSSWNKMLKYNVQDVLLLEQIYNKFKSWITNHPNFNLYNNTEMKCPTCGENKLFKNGIRYSKTNVYQRYRCKGCGSNCQSSRALKVNKPKVKS